METILDQQRRIHEERERIVDSMVKETLHIAKTVSAGRVEFEIRLSFSIIPFRIIFKETVCSHIS